MLQVTYIIVGGVTMSFLIVLIVGTILGIYFYKREEPMHVSSWIKGILVIVAVLLIVDFINHFDQIKDGFLNGSKDIDKNSPFE